MNIFLDLEIIKKNISSQSFLYIKVLFYLPNNIPSHGFSGLPEEVLKVCLPFPTIIFSFYAGMCQNQRKEIPSLIIRRSNIDCSNFWKFFESRAKGILLIKHLPV